MYTEPARLGTSLRALGMPKKERDGQLPLELTFTDDHLGAASFAPSPGSDGGLFTCSIGPITEEAVGELLRAARNQTPIRLRFSERPLLLDHVTGLAVFGALATTV